MSATATTSDLAVNASPGSLDPRQIVQQAIAHLDHVLPAQAPILNFVHHNTLHGYQHLPFEEALAAAEALTGIHAYLPDAEFRKLFHANRIVAADIDAAFAQHSGLDTATVLAQIGPRTIQRGEVLRIALIHGVEACSLNELIWRIEEREATRCFEADVPEVSRQRLLDTARHAGISEPAAALDDLWSACLEGFQLPAFNLHPEELVDLPLTLAKSLLTQIREQTTASAEEPIVHKHMQAEALALLERLYADVGDGISLRGLLRVLTGEDFFERVRPLLIRLAAAHLDEGLAAWSLPDRADGFYTAWRHMAQNEAIPGSQLNKRADDPVEVIVAELDRLGIPPERWEGYLRRLALELPGWSGMMNWRQHHPEYPANRQATVALSDYLAVRLCLDRTWIEQWCREHWQIEGTLSALYQHLRQRPAEVFIRQALYAGRLPEYLASQARELSTQHAPLSAWDSLADMVWTWLHSPVAAESDTHTVHGSAWRLFRLVQHLGLDGAAVRSLPLVTLERLLEPLNALSAPVRGALWQCAYEHHYRDALLNALANNHQRWPLRPQRAQAQIVFCIDDREEGIRRHLEELNPQIETFGAAGFFGVAMNWRGLDDTEVTPLCPVVVTPTHEIREVGRSGAETRLALHEQRRHLRDRLKALYQEIRRNIGSSALLIDLLAPAILPLLAGKVFAPGLQGRLAETVHARWVPAAITEVAVNAADTNTPATPEQPRLGFSDLEQADRVATLLRNIGLTQHFAPLVILMGHGSMSQNNPHLGAYDCGACGGRHGGPNARTFAAMANRPAVRALLPERGVTVPADTWFIGAEHNTCDECITFYDRDTVPATMTQALQALQPELDQACALSAQERCRRFASAPNDPEPDSALRHVIARSRDFSQARPELGHATNVAALVGRRLMSQGVFLDRRAFLVSYDSTQDPTGAVLEGILLAVGPVGAGINLEYYFSTVNNERLGCGTKTPHNVTGLFAVMEGASSDLRTGLPRQMIEIHEPVRLQIVIEAQTEIVAAIYSRQAGLRELIGNGWVHVIVKDPDTGVFAIFDPAQGFVPWTGPIRPLPLCACSSDWYRGQREPLPPALIGNAAMASQPERDHHA